MISALKWQSNFFCQPGNILEKSAKLSAVIWKTNKKACVQVLVCVHNVVSCECFCLHFVITLPHYQKVQICVLISAELKACG